jgi:phosphoribosylanthranilate isomerase
VTRVKFCGITNVDDAELCAGHGAWALGMIFVHSSPRRCKQSEAARIVGALRRRVELVGVFQNATLDHVVHTAEALQLSMVQLHGDEGPSYAAEVARRTGVKVIKAARISSRADVVALQPFTTDFHLLDGAGGVPFDWGLVRAHRSPVPLITAGGLTPDNVEDAIRATEPFAVDVASGIEASGGRAGIKDPEKVAAFAAAAAGATVA